MRKIILPKKKIDEIINLYESGLGQTKISKQLNISKHIIIRVLKENDIPIIGTKRYFADEHFFEKINTEEKAYWLGFLFADGYVRVRKGKYGELKLKLQKKDKNHIQLFKENIKSTNVIKDIIEKYKYKDEIRNSFSSAISIYSTKIVSDLIKLGCVEKKSKTLEFPLIQKELIRHFIRGYFDGDGCVHLNTKLKLDYSICSGSEEFLVSIKNVFDSVGITSQSLTKNSNGVYLLRIYRINDQKRIYNYFYDDATTFLERKKDIFEEVNNFKEGRNKWIN